MRKRKGRNQNRKFFRKGTAVFLSTAMLLGMIPVTGKSLTVHAEAAVKNVNLNQDGTIAGINNPDIPEDKTSSWSGSYVYFGAYNGNPVKYRVLDKNTTDFNISPTMFLDCDTVLLPNIIFDSTTSVWSECNLRKYLNSEDAYSNTGFLMEGFTETERSAIADSENESHGGWEGDIADGNMYYAKLTGEKIFVLDIREVLHQEYGYFHIKGTGTDMMSNGIPNRHKENNIVWWLRSQAVMNPRRVSGSMYGILGEWDINSTTPGISPALNLDLSSLLFTSAVDADKSTSFAMTTDGGASDIWKLTVQDGTGFAAARTAGETGMIPPGENMHVTVSAVPKNNTETYTQTSAMLVDGSGTVVVYGKIADSAAVGNIEITVPESVPEGDYTLKVFAETVKSSASANLTDYASNMADIPVTISRHTHSFGTQWKYDSDNHWRECNCGEKAEVAVHTGDGGTVTTEPTENSPGIKTFKCSVCGYVIRTEEIPKLESSQDTYIITYDANGGSGTMEKGTATEGVAFTLPENGFSAPEGKQFKEWAVGSVDGTRVRPGESHTFTGETTVYAIWEKKSDTNADTNEGGGTPESSSGQNPGTSSKPSSQNTAASSESTSPQNLTSVPKTGDSMPVVWFALMMVSGIGVIGIVFYGKKRKADS